MNEGKDNSRKKKIIICVVAVLVLLTALILFLYNRNRISATTMRILRLEGEVTLTDDGKDKPVKEELRLNSGNELSTAVKSLVSIGLDDVKIVTLDQLSRAQFNQDGRKLDLELTAGSLFFEVQQPLQDDETMDIRTSTMIVGIRGTSGWVSVDGEHEQLIVTDGVVHVTGRNPVTGEVKEIDVHAGERITVYLYNDRKVDSIEFILEKITERDLPEFVLERLRENRTLLDKVCRETGWDKPWILGEAEDEVPKVVIDDNGNDNGSDDAETDTVPEPPAEETDTKAPDTGNAKSEDTKSGSGPLTRKQLAWAHSHVAVIEPNSGVMALSDMTLFDPAFYARTNPDVVAMYGTDPDALLYHYLTQGKAQGRPPIALPTPTPVPSWVNAKPAEHHEEEDNDNSSSGGGGGPSYPHADSNGNVTLSDGSTGVWDPTQALPFQINSATGNTVTIPKAIIDNNNQQQTLNTGMVGINPTNVTTVNFTDSDFNDARALSIAQDFLAVNPNVTTVNAPVSTVTKNNAGINIAIATGKGNNSVTEAADTITNLQNVGTDTTATYGGQAFQYDPVQSGNETTTTVASGSKQGYYTNVQVDSSTGRVSGIDNSGGTPTRVEFGTITASGFTPDP